jgi:hypothetical protein
MRSVVLVVLLVGCKGAQTSDVREPPADDATAEGDNFGNDGTVRILTPGNNATLSGVIELTFSAGDAVDSLAVNVDGSVAASGVATDVASIPLDLGEGRHTVTLLGMDADAHELSRDTIVIRELADVSSYVSLTSPADGATVVNPVQFTFDVSDDVDDVEILADGWSLGHAGPGEILSYSFGGTGYSRAIEAIARDSAGHEIASDEMSLTVQDPAPAKVSSFNAKVLDLIKEYPTDSSIDYYWPSGVDWSGSTRDIRYQDALVADDGGFSSCFCVGMTWEIYLRAWLAIDKSEGGDGTDLHGLSSDDMFDMRDDWFVRDIRGPGASAAFEDYGLGVEVESFDDWQPGDFIQFWRHSGSGHNVIFIDWMTNSSGARIGFQYWSCNGSGSTNGPGYNEEYFGSSGSSIDPMYTYGARAYMPEDWY